MKRSKFLKLSLMLATTSLASCSKPTSDELLKESLVDCIDGNSSQVDYCLSQYQVAKNNIANDERFASKEECELKYGQEACLQDQTQNDSGGSSWLPFFAGMAASNVIDSFSDNRYQRQNEYQSNKRARNDSINSNYQQKNNKKVTKSRGGFGRSAARFSWGG